MSGAPPPMLSRFKAVGNTVYTSGVTAVPGDAPTQIRGCFEKLKGILADAGLTMRDVQKVTIYLANLPDREAHLNPIWREYFPTNPPCRTVVQAGLGIALVEMEAVAARTA
jgi:2-iminobutanoate/2-iminopropanoate deaminase